MAKKPTKGAFIAEALVVDQEPTAYNTRFKDGALMQIASKVNSDGVPLLLSHDSSKLPSGAWFEAKVEGKAVLSKFFIPSEINEFDDVRTRIESDILDSVSVGFNAKVHECSICHNSIYDYDACPHIPGREYDVKGEDGKSLGEDTCYVLLDDIKLSEISLVYSGAVPAAKIVDYDNKQEFFEKNHLQFDEGQLEIVQKHCTYHIYDENKPEGDNQMTKEEYQELQTKYADTRESLLSAREEALNFKEKASKYDAAVADKDAAVAAKEESDTKYTDSITALQEKVTALAAPFEADYAAPSDIEVLFSDLDRFIELAKALPSGQQSRTEDAEVEYSAPDDVYKV
jgi:phage head maturation protease